MPRACGQSISEILLPVFRTDFGVTKWCHYLPGVEKENVFYMETKLASSPEFVFILHLVLLICGFVVGYSFKPILDTSRFDLIKNEFESREAILKEQLQCANGEKLDIQEQIKKLQQVTTRYRKEFPKLKLETQGTEGEIEMLSLHLNELRQEKIEIEKKTFQIISDFAGVQQALLPSEHMSRGPDKDLKKRVEKLEKLLAKQQANEKTGKGDSP